MDAADIQIYMLPHSGPYSSRDSEANHLVALPGASGSGRGGVVHWPYPQCVT